MKERIFFINVIFEKLKGLLIWLVRTKAIGHAWKLGGITGLEALFQKGMHKFLVICGATDATHQLFEFTTFGLYLLGCMFLVIKYGITLYFETKKEVVESQTKLLKMSIYKVEN